MRLCVWAFDIGPDRERGPKRAQLVSKWPRWYRLHCVSLRLAETYAPMTAAVWKPLSLVLVVAYGIRQCAAVGLSQLAAIDTLTSHKDERQM